MGTPSDTPASTTSHDKAPRSQTIGWPTRGSRRRPKPVDFAVGTTWINRTGRVVRVASVRLLSLDKPYEVQLSPISKGARPSWKWIGGMVWDFLPAVEAVGGWIVDPAWGGTAESCTTEAAHG